MSGDTDDPRLLLGHAAVALSNHVDALRKQRQECPPVVVVLRDFAIDLARVHRVPLPDLAPRELSLLLTLPHAAGLLEVSESTVKRLIDGGELASVVVAGRRRVRRADLDAFAEQLPPAVRVRAVQDGSTLDGSANAPDGVPI